MTTTIQQMQAMKARGMNARTIAMKVYGAARYEGEVCSLLALPPVTGAVGENGVAQLPLTEPREADRALLDRGAPFCVAELAVVVGRVCGLQPSRLVRKPGEAANGRSSVNNARAAFIVMLIDALGYSRKEVGIMLNYKLDDNGGSSASITYRTHKAKGERACGGRLREVWQAWRAYRAKVNGRGGGQS